MTELSSTQTETDLLRRLADESEIRQVLARYARGIDRGDFDMVRDCYHEDATDAHGAYNGDLDGFVKYSQDFMDKMESMTHHLTQSVIEIDGDNAWVETYCLCYIRLKAAEGETPKDRLGNIRYVDLFERRDGTWRIAHRKLVHHPGRLDPVDPVVPLAEKAFLARMDADDPSNDRRPESFLP
jgi:ketosteroid isomerase-like protein